MLNVLLEVHITKASLVLKMKRKTVHTNLRS